MYIIIYGCFQNRGTPKSSHFNRVLFLHLLKILHDFTLNLGMKALFGHVYVYSMCLYIYIICFLFLYIRTMYIYIYYIVCM